MNYYNEIKLELINNEITKQVKNYSINRSDLKTYYNVGKLLSEAGKHYGEGIIKEYSKKLKIDLNKKYSVRLLYRMLKYYNFVIDEKMPTVSANLSISHYDEILSLNDVNKIKYYLTICEQQNLSVRQLREKIKSNEYERLDEETKRKIKENDEIKVTDLVKNPIIIKNKNNYNIITEKVLQRLILEDIPFFLRELGSGFTFIENEYKIKIGDRYNYIDLLLYNIEFNCYVVVELKIIELKKEHIGQIQVYMNYIDIFLKTINQDKTIGIIICKRDNKYIIEYSSDRRIIARSYEISK
jgi:predicted nuclease of restriction endonuclease-like (RecB) superfamily